MKVLRLPADATHGAGGGGEAGLADSVAGFFLQGDVAEVVAQFIIGRTGPEAGAEIVFNVAEETGAELPVSG